MPKSQMTKIREIRESMSAEQLYRLEMSAVVMDKDPEWFDRHLEECNRNDREFRENDVIKRAKQLLKESDQFKCN